MTIFMDVAEALKITAEQRKQNQSYAEPGGERAKEFSSKAGSSHTLAVYQRARQQPWVILRDETHTNPLQTGRISIAKSKEPLDSTVKDRQTLLGEFGISQSVKIADDVHLGAMVIWSETTFAQFAFNLSAMIQGKYESGRLSSSYGIGNSMIELMRDAGAKVINLQR
jgi:hypothetical protein